MPVFAFPASLSARTWAKHGVEADVTGGETWAVHGGAIILCSSSIQKFTTVSSADIRATLTISVVIQFNKLFFKKVFIYF